MSWPNKQVWYWSKHNRMPVPSIILVKQTKNLEKNNFVLDIAGKDYDTIALSWVPSFMCLFKQYLSPVAVPVVPVQILVQEPDPSCEFFLVYHFLLKFTQLFRGIPHSSSWEEFFVVLLVLSMLFINYINYVSHHHTKV